MSKISPVPDNLIGARLDVAVAKMLGVSRARADVFIESGQVGILGKTTDKASRLTATDLISLDIEQVSAAQPVAGQEPEPEASGLSILYEDEDIVVVDKPVGVAAHASVGWQGPTVLGTLLARGVRISEYGPAGRQGIVSRLDVGTSGVMLVCKSELAYVEMRRQFSEHEVTKIYHAMPQGSLPEPRATIDAPIGRDRVSDFRFTVSPSGKPAITHYDLLEAFGDASLVKVNLETGRTHQIRVHFASIGHPLVGDPLYGANPVQSARLGLNRQWLHAVSLGFRHPRTRLWTTVESSYPADLQAALDLERAKATAAGE